MRTSEEDINQASARGVAPHCFRRAASRRASATLHTKNAKLSTSKYGTMRCVKTPTRRPKQPAPRAPAKSKEVVRPGAYAASVIVGRSYLYGDIALELRRRITEGIYPPHGKIPSLSDLTREFNVSAITIRRALHELMYEGLVVAHQGLGIFVTARQRIYRVMSPDRSFGDEIRRAGFVPHIKEIDFRRELADAEVAGLLGVP